MLKKHPYPRLGVGNDQGLLSMCKYYWQNSIVPQVQLVVWLQHSMAFHITAVGIAVTFHGILQRVSKSRNGALVFIYAKLYF